MDIFVLPPQRFRKTTPDGKRILWKWDKWLQGGKGAGNAARAKFEAILADNAYCNFTKSSWDHSLFLYRAGRSFIEFTLHGDDGTLCADSEQTALKLKTLLEKTYGSVKWHMYEDMLGFAVAEPPGLLRITAPKHIDALRTFVENDPPYKPTVPYTKEFDLIEPCDVPETGSVEWYAFDARVYFMQEAGGHVAHIIKVRPDSAAALSMVVRYSHCPDARAVRCLKHLIFYLLNTVDVGITVHVPDNPTVDMLVWPAALHPDHVLDVNCKPAQYHVVLDGALSIDRSRCGIFHMFAGVAIATQAFRQHSIAITAHDSEVFTASTGAAQSVPIRGILHEVDISQALPTPIFSDSASTRLVANSEAALRKSIYIARRVLFMREGVHDGEYTFHTCIGKTNPANPLTKVVPSKEAATARKYYMGM